ncbi:hypothetical protein TNCV_3896971 [Trichonephila clavipes]|nr:hypothetical protein TNCV_3896971 [Trichonephila clavipes]
MILPIVVRMACRDFNWFENEWLLKTLGTEWERDYDIDDDTEDMDKKSHDETDGSGDDEAHFWLNSYVSKQNCRIWSEANPQVYVETPLHPEKLTVWCALWAGGIHLQKR